LTVQSTCVLWTWKRPMTVSPKGFCVGCCRSMGYRGRFYKLFGFCITKAGAAFAFLAQGRTRLRCVFDYTRADSPILFFMDRISKCSRGEEYVWFGNLSVTSLLFADEVVPLASSSHGLQCALKRFTVEWEAAGMKVSSSKFEAMVLNRKQVSSAPSGSGMIPCLRQRSLRILGSCS